MILILDWLKSLFEFFCKTLWKTQMKFLPNTTYQQYIYDISYINCENTLIESYQKE